jgi:hypothetical protein
MKKMFLAVVMLSLMPLSACAELHDLNSPITATTPAIARAEYDAEASYNAVATAYLSANSHGLLSASQKAGIKPVIQQMYSYLKIVRGAYKVGDAVTVTDKANAIQALYAQVYPLIPKSK